MLKNTANKRCKSISCGEPWIERAGGIYILVMEVNYKSCYVPEMRKPFRCKVKSFKIPKTSHIAPTRTFQGDLNESEHLKTFSGDSAVYPLPLSWQSGPFSAPECSGRGLWSDSGLHCRMWLPKTAGWSRWDGLECRCRQTGRPLEPVSERRKTLVYVLRKQVLKCAAPELLTHIQ